MSKLRYRMDRCVFGLAVSLVFGCIGGSPEDVLAPAPAPDLNSSKDRLVDGSSAEWGEAGNGYAFSPKVYFGTPRPTHVPLTAGQILAVGKFYNCSGTLITPRWVLTASHCGLRGQVWFCMGAEPANPDRCVRSRRVIDNPRGDMALVELERDAREVIPEVEPIPLLHEDLGRAWIGTRAEAGGYGRNEHGEYGRRAFTAEPISQLWGDTMTIDGQGERGVCFGDSGGPVMVVASDGSARLAGDLSNGDGSCVGQDNYTRVDAYREWLTLHAGPIPGSGEGVEPIAPPDRPEPEPLVGCGDLDFIGRCSGDTVEYCKEDSIRRVDCAAQGLACDWHSRDVGWWCVERSGCGDLDYFGACEGSTARWCDDEGEVLERDCDRFGMGCGWVDDQTGNYCTDAVGDDQPEEPPPVADDDPAVDSDGDGIVDALDLCSATPAGSAIWRQGEWTGCAGGQFRD